MQFLFCVVENEILKRCVEELGTPQSEEIYETKDNIPSVGCISFGPYCVVRHSLCCPSVMD